MEIDKVYKVYHEKEALDLLAKYKGKAEILAGGTDLVVHIREGKNGGSIIVDISDITEMKKIKIRKKEIILGTLTTFTEIVDNQYIRNNVHGLWKAAKSIGSPQIRNMATIGGNICNGSPAADIVVPLLALNASLDIKSNAAQRTMGLNEFYHDKSKTALKTDEMLIDIRIPHLKDRKIVIGFEKLGQRNALAISKISCSIYFELEENHVKDIRIASGALGKYPLREYMIEDFMKGKILNDESIELAAIRYSEILTKRLAGRSSCDYKKEAIKGIFKKTVKSCLKQVGELYD